MRDSQTKEGLFIVFEGVEGAGKSSQIKLLSQYLDDAGYSVVVTKEPGGTPIGEAIREILLNPDFSQMGPETETLLYSASRAQHVTQVILPALEEGKIVLCDRYVASSYAYQSFGRGLPLAKIKELNEWATGGLKPDLTIIFSVPIKEGLGRATKHYADRIEQEGIDFHSKVQEGYLELTRKNPGQYKVIEGAGSKEAIHQEVLKVVKDLLKA